jgi:AraC-like DNA-binding protein
VSVELFNFNDGYGVYSNSNYKTAKHSHYAIEIVFSTGGSFCIKTNLSNYTDLKSVIIPSNLTHSFSCINATCNLLFVDPLSDIGIYFIQQYDLTSLKDVIVNPSDLSRFYKKDKFDISLILKCAQSNHIKSMDYRILNCVREINSHVTDEKITLLQLSKASFLSESRLAHLFKEQLGISVHQCILWKKIFLAALKSREGYSLTECAHYLGFSDSSHFYKVFHKMFGVNPFFVLKD